MGEALACVHGTTAIQISALPSQEGSAMPIWRLASELAIIEAVKNTDRGWRDAKATNKSEPPSFPFEGAPPGRER
jgi:hypothetical protein